MTGHGAALRIRRPPTCIPRTVRAYARRGTWRASRACCRWMGMLDSSAWRAIARTVPCNWPSAGCTCGVPSTSSTLLPGRRSRPNCWHAWPAYMRSRLRYEAIPPNTGGGCDAHEVGRSSKRCMIGCTISCHASLAHLDLAKAIRYAIRRWPGPGGVPRRRPHRDGHEHGRTCHPANYPHTQERAFCWIGWWGPSLGDRDDADPNSQD